MNPLRKITVYSKMSLKGLLNSPNWQTFLGIIKYFPKWWSLAMPGRNSVKDQLPWLTFAAIEFIKKIVRPDMTVFEYGSGGSTLFWASRVKKVVSVEHETEWYERILKECQKREFHNVEYVLEKAQIDENFSSKNFANPLHNISADPLFNGKKFDSYVQRIDSFLDQYFDIVLIDGRARPSCIHHALGKVKKNGYLIIDNSERDYYLSPFDFNALGWKRWDFSGPVPYNYGFSQTSIFQKLK